MSKITNNAKEILEMHEWEAVVNLMDSELREELNTGWTGGDLEFLEAYIELHAEKFGEEFTVN